MASTSRCEESFVESYFRFSPFLPLTRAEMTFVPNKPPLSIQYLCPSLSPNLFHHRHHFPDNISPYAPYLTTSHPPSIHLTAIIPVILYPKSRPQSTIRSYHPFLKCPPRLSSRKPSSATTTAPTPRLSTLSSRA